MIDMSPHAVKLRRFAFLSSYTLRTDEEQKEVTELDDYFHKTYDHPGWPVLERTYFNDEGEAMAVGANFAALTDEELVTTVNAAPDMGGSVIAEFMSPNYKVVVGLKKALAEAGMTAKDFKALEKRAYWYEGRVQAILNCEEELRLSDIYILLGLCGLDFDIIYRKTA